MYFTGLRTHFLKSTGIRSCGFIAHDDAADTSTLSWLEAHYKPEAKYWTVEHCSRVSTSESLTDVVRKDVTGPRTFKDAVQAMLDFEHEQSQDTTLDIWPVDRNLADAVAIIKDQKYSLRHKIMNIGLPKF